MLARSIPVLRASACAVIGRTAQFNPLKAFHATSNVLSKSTPRIAQSIPQSITSSNPPLTFPCLDANKIRETSLDGGPEPLYEKIVTGYSVFHHSHPFLLDHGGILPEFNIAYETWGKLNADKSNAILIHTGLSGSSHAKSHSKNTSPGWWENFIGPGLDIDTDKFFVICTNVIGGCYGSTGPSSTDPADGEKYATRFPILTVMDMVRAQILLLDSLGIQRLHASVGASMGGMQSLAAGVLMPERVGRLITISACARSHPYSIALRHTQRQVLMSDPNWNRGFYYKGVPPHVGMKLAREIATISYRSGPEWERRFGRKRAQPDGSPALCPDFLIETYLDHQGERFCLQYDPNSLLYISKAMDLFALGASSLGAIQTRREANQGRLQEILASQSKGASAGEACRRVNGSALDMRARSNEAEGHNNVDLVRDLVEGMSSIKMPTLVLGVQSDILFPVWQQKEIAECLRQAGNKEVTYYELDSIYGHDTFLIDRVSVGGAVKGHLELVD